MPCIQEAQEISTALIAAEQRIGEILLAIPKAQGKRSDVETSAERVAEVKSKSEIIAEQGYERHEAHDYQQMAKHPEVVQAVIESAIASGEVVTRRGSGRTEAVHRSKMSGSGRHF